MRSSPGPRPGQAPVETLAECGWKGCRVPPVPGQIRCAEHGLVIERPRVLESERQRFRRKKIEPRNMRPQVRAITEAVSNAYGGIPMDEIRKPGRSCKTVELVRMAAMYSIRHCTSMSYPEIGMEFGGRDDTTVLSAVRRIGQFVAKQDAQVLFAIGAGITAGRQWAQRVLSELEAGKAAAE